MLVEVSLQSASATRGVFHPLKTVESLARKAELAKAHKSEKRSLQRMAERIETLWSFLQESGVRPLCFAESEEEFRERLLLLYKVVGSVLLDLQEVLGEAQEIFARIMEEGESGELWPSAEEWAVKEGEFSVASSVVLKMSKIVKKNFQAIKEMGVAYPEREASRKVLCAVVEMMDPSTKAQACLFVLLSVAYGEVPKPALLLWEIFLKEAWAKTKLFEQASQAYLWSETPQGMKAKERLRSLAKRVKARREEASTSEPNEEIRQRLKKRDAELYEEFAMYRQEHLNQGAK